MKALKTTLAAIAMLFCVAASAQDIGSSRIGVIGGFTSSDSNADIFKTSSYSLYHIGVAFQYPLVAGFVIQPALTYQMKGATLDGVQEAGLSNISLAVASLDTKVGYAEIPVQIQWGPDLVAFRPYVFAEPFVGFAVNTANKIESDLVSSGTILDTVTDFKEAAINRLEYGAGVGAGCEFSRFQISARYFWNFGSLYSESGEMNAVGQTIKAAYEDKKNFNGFSVSVAVFF